MSKLAMIEDNFRKQDIIESQADQHRSTASSSEEPNHRNDGLIRAHELDYY
jgi:hypothetical protein